MDSIVDSGLAPPPTGTAGVHKRFYQTLETRDVEFEINKEFNHPGLFVGVSLTLKNITDVSELLKVEGVKAIRPLRKFSRPQPFSPRVVASVENLGFLTDSQATHVLTGVDKLHAEGITGDGIKIGIIDTGIDYTHPALGQGFGPGFKVIGGYDLVGDDYDGNKAPVPDPDPLDQCSGHGTHVAGIIGADSSENPFNISGVAYSASLSAYRVFGCVGFVTDDVIVEALLLGVKDGQDILTLSLSGADGWTEATVSVVASRIAQSGTVVTAAAGNDGDIGSWYSSGPGNGIGVVSVASLDNTVTYLQSATVQGAQHAPIIYYNLFPMPVRKPIPIYATSNNTGVLDDACNPLPDNIPDLSQFLVVVRRGTCNILDKLTNIAAKGGQVAFVYDDGSGFSAIDVGNFTASLIQAADGEFLVKQFAAGASITVSFPRSGSSVEFPNPDGGLISSFTSYGPTNDFFFKPAITAPGGNILSTLPVPLGSYGLDSGTSMATPFVAGSAALLLQMRGKSADFVRNIQTLLETTAVAVPADHSDDSLLQTLAQQGAGLLNVSNAAHTTTIVSPGELILNDTAHFHGEQQFTVHNAGSSEKTFNLSHIPAGTAITVAPGTIFPANGPLSLTNDFVTVALSETSFTLKADESKTITATFTPPEGLEPSTFPIISGFIRISPDGDAPLHVSYLGLAASLRDKQVLDTTDVFFGITLPALLNARGDVQEVPTNYTFNSDTADFPTVFFRLVFGTPILRLDLVDTSAKLEMKTGPGKRAATGEASFTFPRNISASFDDILTLGPLYEADYVPRNDDVPRGNPVLSLSLATPTFANGTVIPNGNYRILLRALRVTGDPEEDSDYESWLSPVIGVAVP